MCQRRRFQFLFLMMVLLVFVVACDTMGDTAVSEPTQIAVMPTKTETPTATPTLLPTATATATLVPSPTATLIPTETATPAPTCPEPGTAVSFPQPADTTELQTAILAYLNAGGQWEDLFVLLDELEIEHDWIEADMNGDGVLETAVYTLLFNEEESVPVHAWWIFQCTSSQYNIIHETWGNWAFHDYFISEDLNNDNREELLVVSGFAGSACTLEPKVWSWQKDKIVDLSPNYLELELGCAIDLEQRVLFQDINGNHVKEMILIGETIGHINHAPLRGITQTFTLDDTGYKLVNTVFAPTNLRVYVLGDAQRALDVGDLPLAVSQYTRAAYEEMTTVGSYNILDPDQDADEYQQSFALFRLAVIQWVIGNEVEANAALTKLNESYLENQPGYEFVVLAQIFFDSYEKEENLSKTCEEVSQYIAEQYEHDDPNLPRLTTHFYWGANIASYITPESFCPVFNID